MEFYDVIETRRSIRGYLDKPVPEESIARISRAVQLAPTAASSSPPGVPASAAGVFCEAPDQSKSSISLSPQAAIDTARQAAMQILRMLVRGKNEPSRKFVCVVFMGSSREKSARMPADDAALY